jgi:cytoplasmic tRNA 2-thiolation protein 2
LTFKFRRALEPFVNVKPDGPRRKALKPAGNLMLGYSGGLGSAVLLDLVYRNYVRPDATIVTSDGGKEHPRNERVWKKVTVCYVEVSDAVPGVSIFRLSAFITLLAATSRRKIDQKRYKM